MITELSDLLRQQADLTPGAQDVAARIRTTITRRRARRRTIAVNATAVAAAAAIAIPSLLRASPAQPQSPLVSVAAAGPSTLPPDSARTEPPPAGAPDASQTAVADSTPVAATSKQPSPAGRTPIVLVAAPAQPGSAVSVGLTPRGWTLAPAAVSDYLSDGRPGALTIFTTGADAADVRDLRSTLWLQLTTATGTGDQPLTDRIGTKRAAVTAPDSRGGWAVLVDEGDGVRSSLNFPSSLDELSREQVEQIAQSITVHDRGQVTVG